MRTIKFRGRRLDNQEWEQGNYVAYKEDDVEDVHCIVSRERNQIGASLDFAPVDPETVGQFTGLLDKNGKEIFEGDILGRHTDGGEIVPLSIVVYADNGFFAQSLVSGAAFNFNLERMLERQNAIGNIHNHPELLKNE